MKYITSIIVLVLFNCGTIFNTSQQLIRIYPNSENSTIFINGKVYKHQGKKFEIKLHRDNFYKIKVLTLEGLEEIFYLDKKISKWFWGSIALGVFGVIPDVASGGLYKLLPYDRLLNTILIRSKKKLSPSVNTSTSLIAEYERLSIFKKKKVLSIKLGKKNKTQQTTMLEKENIYD